MPVWASGPAPERWAGAAGSAGPRSATKGRAAMGPDDPGDEPNADRVEIRRLGPSDGAVVRAAASLFDHTPRPDATARFLHDPRHHLLIAFVDGAPAGFVSGVEMTHPDKGTEMFLYELGVDARFRRRGLGRRLTEDLAALARARGCYGMWVLTDDANEAAVRTYLGAGARRATAQRMLAWAW